MDADLVRLRFEGHVAQPGFTAIVHPLVVAQDLVNLVAVISGVGANGLSSVMTAENHEDVLVLLDELLPRLLTGVAFDLHSTRGIS